MATKSRSPDDVNRETLKRILETPVPRTYKPVHERYEAAKKALANKGVSAPSRVVADSLRDVLEASRADVSSDIAARLPGQASTDTGRSLQFQGIVKNVGENFTSLVAVNLAENLIGTGWCVVRGMHPDLKPLLQIGLKAPDGSDLVLKVESDISLYRPEDRASVVLSAKTTLKERLHIAVMWRLVLEAAKNKQWADSLGIKQPADLDTLRRMKYCFVTADIGSRPDLNYPRNLIKADASLFDYFFAARNDLRHIPSRVGKQRDKIFYRLSAIYEVLEGL